MHTCFVDDATSKTVEGVNFAQYDSLANTAEARITRTCS